MKFRLVLFGFTPVATAIATVLLKLVDADPEVRVIVWVLILTVGGTAIGVFADQIPEPPRWLTRYRRRGSAGEGG